MIILHLDDFLYAGEKRFFENVIQILMNKYSISKLSHGIFTYIGLDIVQEMEGISFNQNRYAEKIEPVRLARRIQDKDEKLTDEEKNEYQKLLGKINWT